MRRSLLLRLSLGLGGLAALSLAFPSAAAARGLGRLLGVTAAMGGCYGLAFGAAYELAPRFGPACTVALTAGYVSAGAAVLALDLAIKRGAPHYSPQQLRALFAAVSGVCLAGWAAACGLLRRHARRLDAATARHGSDGGGGGGSIHVKAGSSGGAGASVLHAGGAGTLAAWRRGARHDATAPPLPRPHSAAQAAADVEAAAGPPSGRASAAGGDSGEWRRVARAVSPAAALLAASVGSSMAAFPFFSYLPPDGALGPWVTQAAFYARLVGDITGRLLPPSWAARSVARLGLWAGVKVALLPLLLPALLRPARVGGDLAVVALVALNWLLSGAVNSGAYLVAGGLVAPQLKPRAGGVMALAFQVGRGAGAGAGVCGAGAGRLPRPPRTMAPFRPSAPSPRR